MLRNGFAILYDRYMYYTYVLLSEKSHIFYYGYTHDLKKRLNEHNSGVMKSTKAHRPWKLVCMEHSKQWGKRKILSDISNRDQEKHLHTNDLFP
jgi:GIY-YIG catalytic domain